MDNTFSLYPTADPQEIASALMLSTLRHLAGMLDNLPPDLMEAVIAELRADAAAFSENDLVLSAAAAANFASGIAYTLELRKQALDDSDNPARMNLN